MSLCDSKQFQAGNVHTDFIKENRTELFHSQEVTPTIAVAAATTYLHAQQQPSWTTGMFGSFETMSKSIGFSSWCTLIFYYL